MRTIVMLTGVAILLSFKYEVTALTLLSVEIIYQIADLIKIIKK